MNILNASQISLCNSAVYVRIDLQNEFPIYFNPTKNTRARLQLTTFDIDDLGNEINVRVHIKDKARISKTDNHITFRIDNELKNDLVRRQNFNNVDFPVLLYNNTSLPYVQGMCLFYRFSYYAYDELTSAVAINKTNNVATLGFRINNEAVAFYGNYKGGMNGFNIAENPIKNFAEYIPFYAKQQFNFGTNRNSKNFITTVKVNPTTTKCVKEPLLIIFINRQGLFEYVTSTGKILKSSDVKRNESDKVFRDSGLINPESTHFKNTSIEESYQSYTINTGILDGSMNGLIHELILSPKIYLIKFFGDRWSQIQQGITVDNNIITVDNTAITIDSDTVTATDIGMYSTYVQIPVYCIDTDFSEKTFINDKREISYTIKLKETASKIKKS